MLKIILIAYGLSAIVTHGRIFERVRCFIGKHSRLLYEGVNCMQCVGFWSGLVVSLLLGQGWVSILYGFATSGIRELTDIVTKKIENMTDYEFQLQNEISELRSTINSLRAELKESLQREEIAKKVIEEQRKEIYELRCISSQQK
jgi:hypothetical protein